MAVPRKNDFPDKDLKLADIAKALSHPARIAILRILATKGECICGDLVADLPLAQSTVSQHLKALQEAGLIKGEIDGPRSCYCIDWRALKRGGALVSAFLQAIEGFERKMSCDSQCE